MNSASAAVPAPPLAPPGATTTAKVAVLPLTFPMVTVPAGTSTAVPKVNVRPFSLSVYDRMVMLSSVFGVVMVGFFALFRRMTQAFVVVTWLVDYANDPLRPEDSLKSGALVTTGTLSGAVELTEPGQIDIRFGDSARLTFSVI